MTQITRPPYYFDYMPLVHGGGYGGEPDCDLVVATSDDVDPARIVELMGRHLPDLTVTSLFTSHPVFWTRVESSELIDPCDLGSELVASGIAVRYITSARRGNQALPPPLDFRDARPRRARHWSARPATQVAEVETPWRWFLRSEGIGADRNLCGTGAGTRLALIDDDGLDLHRVHLDAEVMVQVDAIPRSQSHAALLTGWAVGATRSDGTSFRGVAPDASPRVYCIPKPGDDVLSLPLAILRAVEDGADVIACATYVDGLASPLLDDALEVAVRLGRGALGVAVLMPTSREMSSPEGSTHASLSLGLGEPASDPRVLCVGPSARDGGWFLWRDRRGHFRPFANRGPSVRWLAPGDDMAMPFASDDRPCHAESSGSCGLAAGAFLLLLAKHPELTLTQAVGLFDLTRSQVDPAHQAENPALGDRRDLEPLGVDGDGHNAKHGYGRINAAGACTAATDPVAFALVKMGENGAAARYLAAREKPLLGLYSPELGRWALRLALGDPNLVHAISSVLRALRLAAARREAAGAPAGYWCRQLGVVLKLLMGKSPSAEHEVEMAQLDARLRSLDAEDVLELERQLLEIFVPTWGFDGASSSVVGLRDSHGRGGTVSRLTLPTRGK